MNDGTVPDDRCGFIYDVSTLHDVGNSCCWRPAWKGGGRCVWHSREGPKYREALEDLAPQAPERLDGAALDAVDLDAVDWFEDVGLIGAELTAVDLRDSSLSGADLREATLEDVDVRDSDFSGVNLEDATLRTCDLRGTDLRHVRFDQAVLSNTRINRGTRFGDEVIYEAELEEATAPDVVEECAQAAVWSYREIHTLHEDNALPYEARQYYLKEKDVRRRLAWKSGHRKRALMAEGTRWVTGYGMSPWRVLATAAAVILVSAFLYPITGGLTETVAAGGDTEAITWTIDDPEAAPQYYLASVYFRSLYFSIVTFTTLGYGDVRPVGEFSRALAGAEALIGQLLVAVLVFVLTRRIS